MIVKSVYDKAFKKYGAVLSGYDYNELFAALEKCNIPESGIEYQPSIASLERTDVFQEMCNRGFGGMAIQIGYVSGENDTLNCLEYHKTSEFNIAKDDVVLILGLQQDIEDGKYDTSKTEAFRIPAGVGIELYATTLHYAPCALKHGSKYQILCVLPKGTNYERPNIINEETTEAKMCLGSNKWLMAHKDSNEAKSGAYVGLVGENLKFE